MVIIERRHGQGSGYGVCSVTELLICNLTHVFIINNEGEHCQDEFSGINVRFFPVKVESQMYNRGDAEARRKVRGTWELKKLKNSLIEIIR
jgi:hypothetical protein